MIGGAFGLIFVVANANTPLGPTAAVVFRILGVAGFILLLIARRRAVEADRSHLEERSNHGSNLIRRRYWQVVAAEAALLAIGFIAIWAIGAPSQTYLAWTALIVGLHFIAFCLTDVWRGGIVIPAALLTLYGTVGLALAATAHASWVTLVSGVFSGFTLLVGSIVATVREARLEQTTRRRYKRTPRRVAAQQGDGPLRTAANVRQPRERAR